MTSLRPHHIDLMAEADKDFFKSLGKHIAKSRKELSMTQAQLAEILNISQQHMASFEAGIRKVPASFLPLLAKTFHTSVDNLLGIEDKATKRGPLPKLQQQMQQLSSLPKAKQRFVSEILDTVIQQAN